MRREPQSMFCVSVRTSALLRHAYLGSFFLDPEDVSNLSMGSIWNLVKEQGFFNVVSEYEAQCACSKA